MTEENEYTTIRIRKSTRDILARYGMKNETYDDIILRLIHCAEREKTNGAHILQ